jgi:hypothetical protein
LGSSDALTGSVALRHCPTSFDFIFSGSFWFYVDR